MKYCSFEKISTYLNPTISIPTFLLLLIFSCTEENIVESKKPPVMNPPQPPDTVLLEPEEFQTLAINNFQIDVYRDGALEKGACLGNGSSKGVIYLGGLWIGAFQNGIAKGNIAWTGSNPRSNFTTLINDEPAGVYYLQKGDVNIPLNYPIDKGAPVDRNGNPVVYGDAMCWSALKTDSSYSSSTVLSQPLVGLSVNQAVYAFEGGGLESTIFLRYEITNNSLSAWNDAYVGFFTDTDIANDLDNSTGYDSLREISYTYIPPENWSDSSLIAGFRFLETPDDIGITSHRIFRKNNYYDADFGEIGFENPIQIHYALKGLSNSGAPMVNPVTGKETKFAFTGDPISGEGWIDVQVDVRSFISSGPFSLNPGETKVVSLAWIVSEDENIYEALTNLRFIARSVKLNESLWRF